MEAKLIFVATILGAAQAVPIWILGHDSRIARSPNTAFGYGSGFSSDVAGIKHSTGIGSSFSTGDGKAYSVGIGSAGSGTYAQGVGISDGAPSTYHRKISPTYDQSSFGSSISSAQAYNGPQLGLARSAVRNNFPTSQLAQSSAQTLRAAGFQSAVSNAENRNGYGSALSNSQFRNGGLFGSAVSTAQNIGAYKASTAHTLQQNGAGHQQSGASSINAPGLQAAQSHAINASY